MKIKAYKAFKHDMTCKDFQYEEGKTYETKNVYLCVHGFHACLLPLDCLRYYSRCDNIYHEVELDGEISYIPSMFTNADSKVAASKITIGKEISITDMKKYEEDLASDESVMDEFLKRFNNSDRTKKELAYAIKVYLKYRGNPRLHLEYSDRLDYYLADFKNRYINDINGIMSFFCDFILLNGGFSEYED